MDKKINLNIAILTISDSRTMDDDKSGNLLCDLVNGLIITFMKEILLKMIFMR